MTWPPDTPCWSPPTRLPPKVGAPPSKWKTAPAGGAEGRAARASGAWDPGAWARLVPPRCRTLPELAPGTRVPPFSLWSSPAPGTGPCSQARSGPFLLSTVTGWKSSAGMPA